MIFKSLILLMILQQTYFMENPSYSKQSSYLQDSGRSMDEITRLLQHVRSRRRGDQKRAKERLISLSGKSNAARERIVKELIAFINVPDMRYAILASQDSYQTFQAVVEILGELKATEALDSLIKCLDCNNGVFGESASRFPVTIAVANMGEAAVPKLSKVLREGSLSMRVYAATTLGMIGGSKAREVLESALQSEREEEVTGSIKIALGRKSGK